MCNYYDTNAKEYIENTINCDMSFHYQKFLKYLPKTGKILDVGFGSGRDMIYFKSLGYDVEGIDTSNEFIKNMKIKGFKVSLLSVIKMNCSNRYDGIWACASLLHVKREELEQAIINCVNALKKMAYYIVLSNMAIKKKIKIIDILIILMKVLLIKLYQIIILV